MSAAVRWVMLVAGLLTFTMVYAAFAPEAALRGLVLCYGGEYLTQPLVVSIAVDALMVVLFIGCLMSLRRARSSSA